MTERSKKIIENLQKERKSYYNEHNFYLRLGKLIEKARKRADLTQEELAKVLDVSRVTMGLMERGTQKTAIHTLFRIADALKVPADELFPEDMRDLLSAPPRSKDLSEEEVLRLRRLLESQSK